MRMRVFVGAVLLCAMATGAWASGTLISEQGAKAAAQGGAFTARASDVTAVYFNPAGLAFQKGMQFAVNLTYINADVKYESPTLGSHTDNAKNFFLPAVYYSTPLSDRVTFGIMANAPFNLATDWSDNFPGRFVSRHAKIVTTDVRLALAFKLDDYNALAIGLDYYDSKLNLVRSLNTSALSTAVNPYGTPVPVPPYFVPFYKYSEGSVDTWLRDQAYGWNISYMYKMKPWSFGLFFHSKATFDYKGHSSFETSPLIGPLKSYFPGEETKLTLTSVPAEAKMGFAYTGDPLEVEFDVQWTQWSSWSRSMAHFGQQTPAVQNEEFVFDWNDTWCYRLGFTYKMNANYDIYWGVLYDQAPVPNSTRTPVLPDADRWSVQFGTGYHNARWSFDWYAMYLKFKEANASNPLTAYDYNGLPPLSPPLPPYPQKFNILPDGVYKGTAYLFGMQFGYKW